MKFLTCWIPEKDFESLNHLVETKHFSNRSEAVRAAIRDLLKEENQKEAIKQVKAFCNIMKGRSIDPESILNIFKEWLTNG